MAENLNDAATAPKRVVVIGAGGFVGSAIVAAVRDRGFAALPLGRGEVDLLAEGSGDTLGGCFGPVMPWSSYRR